MEKNLEEGAAGNKIIGTGRCMHQIVTYLILKGKKIVVEFCCNTCKSKFPELIFNHRPLLEK